MVVIDVSRTTSSRSCLWLRHAAVLPATALWVAISPLHLEPVNESPSVQEFVKLS